MNPLPLYIMALWSASLAAIVLSVWIVRWIWRKLELDQDVRQPVTPVFPAPEPIATSPAHRDPSAGFVSAPSRSHAPGLSLRHGHYRTLRRTRSALGRVARASVGMMSAPRAVHARTQPSRLAPQLRQSQS